MRLRHPTQNNKMSQIGANVVSAAAKKNMTGIVMNLRSAAGISMSPIGGLNKFRATERVWREDFAHLR